jgi:calcium permeable stress-gated cation channel
MLTFVAAIFLVTVGALLFSIEDFTEGTNISQSVGSGSIYIAVLILAVVMQMAIIVPGMLLLQPMNLWHTVRNEKRAITPRQRFRGT